MTISGFALTLTVCVLNWALARKKGQKARAEAVTNALLSTAAAMILVRELFGEPPLWIDVPLTILLALILSFVLVLTFVRLKRYLRRAWSLEDQPNK